MTLHGIENDICESEDSGQLAHSLRKFVHAIYRNIFSFKKKTQKKTNCGYTLEPPRRGVSIKYQQPMF